MSIIGPKINNNSALEILISKEEVLNDLKVAHKETIVIRKIT